jgi:DNA-binding beta-propeller fold protein YncE
MGGDSPARWIDLMVLSGFALLLCCAPSTALASCEGPCSPEQLASGLVHPPSWAAAGGAHFEPESGAAAAYPAGELEEVGPIEFHEGGVVQHSPKVHVIFWGSNFEETSEGKEVRSMLLKLYEGMSHSAYEGILTQYFDTTGRVSSVVETSSYIDTSVKAPENLTNLKIEEEITKVIGATEWTPETNAQFVVTTAPGSTYEEHSGCAYHKHTTESAHVLGEVVFDFVPYQGDKPFTENGCIEKGNPSKNPVRKTSKSAAHEFAEAATDPYGKSWYNNEIPHREIADKCEKQEDFELADGAWAQNLYDDHENQCSHEDLDPPHVYSVTEPAYEVTASGAKLEGTVDAEQEETRYYFELGSTTAYGTRTKEAGAGSGVSNVEVKEAVCGLLPSTIYDFRIAATNATGTTYGENLTFNTASSGGGGCPYATTEAASGVGVHEATLNGVVNPNGSEAEYVFEYGTSTAYGKKTTMASAGSGMSGVKESRLVAGLTAATEYHCRLVVTNSAGTTYGVDKTFTTPVGPPTVSTGPATGAMPDEAVLHGGVNPNGLATTDQFEYGTTTSYGTTVPVSAESAGSGGAEVAKGYVLSGLQPNTTYHFRLVASNSSGIVDGGDASFTTPPLAPAFSSAFGKEGTGSGEFDEPTGVAVNPVNGIVIVSDEKNNRIEEFAESGAFVRAFGHKGSGSGELDEPRGVAVDSKGDVWVTDTGNDRVEEFTEQGEYLSQFGTKGTANGQFEEPKGIALSPSGGDVWVADGKNARVQEFNGENKYVRKFSAGTNPVGVAVDASGNVWSDNEDETGAIEEHNSKGVLLQQFATRGSGSGQVSKPRRIALDSYGHLWVADAQNQRIEVFGEKGEYITNFGSFGTGGEEMHFPTGVAVDPRGNVWIADDENNRIDKWKIPSSWPPIYSGAFGEEGIGSGEFDEPTGVAVSPINGTVVVSDEQNDRIEEFTEGGGFIEAFGHEGSGSGELEEPRGVAVDSKGDVWVTDTGNDRVEEFSEQGSYLSQFGAKGTASGQFEEPKGIAWSPSGSDVWVADSGNDRIQEFNQKGKFIRQFSAGTDPVGVAVDASGNVWSDNEDETGAIEEHSNKGVLLQQFATRGSGSGQVSKPRRVAFDSSGHLWVADAQNQRVEVFGEGGAYIASFGSLGSGGEEMHYPTGVAVDARGDVWVADDENDRIDEWIR